MNEQIPKSTPHEEAVDILEKHMKVNIGGSLEATADCNQCSEKLTINLVERGSSVARNAFVGTVRPDLTIFDSSGEPVRFIEVVDSHAPDVNVHEYAMSHDIEVVEFHLRARGEFQGKRRNRALDQVLRVKARIEALTDKRLAVDAHNILCPRPKCSDCGTPLPLRLIVVSTKDCWNCGQNVNVAVGYKDQQDMEQDEFTHAEREFVEANSVILERRFSATVRAKYLANICTQCDQIQGNWYLYMDPYHERFRLHRAEREVYGPCDQCATTYCPSHDFYRDYDGDKQCPGCLEESERVMCPNQPDRECFYPDKCETTGCYFVNRNKPAAQEAVVETLEGRAERWRNADLAERERMLAEWRQPR